MAINKQKKSEVIDKLSKAVSGAVSLVFVNFHGLNVADTTKLRKTLTTKKVGYVVAKKTLLKRALGTTKIEGDIPALDGEVALVYGNDPIEPAREINVFQKDHKGEIKIIGGVFEGKYMDAVSMMEIATIPPREVLLAQFVNLINSPIQRFAVVLSQIVGKKGEAVV